MYWRIRAIRVGACAATAAVEAAGAMATTEGAAAATATVEAAGAMATTEGAAAAAVDWSVKLQASLLRS
jgi:hypothetical protein